MADKSFGTSRFKLYLYVYLLSTIDLTPKSNCVILINALVAPPPIYYKIQQKNYLKLNSNPRQIECKNIRKYPNICCVVVIFDLLLITPS